MEKVVRIVVLVKTVAFVMPLTDHVNARKGGKGEIALNDLVLKMTSMDQNVASFVPVISTILNCKYNSSVVYIGF